jgi:hypothetical protein
MLRKPIELPPAVARRFVEDIRAFHAEPNAIKRDEIAARHLFVDDPLRGPIVRARIRERNYLRTPELNGAVPILGALGAGALRT